MERPNTTQRVIDQFSKLLDAQDIKGFEKYGETIDEAQIDDEGKPYDWKLMALEETADLQKYLVKEIQRLENDNLDLIKIVSTIMANHNCQNNRKTIFEWSSRNECQEPYEDICEICGDVLHQYGPVSQKKGGMRI